jgi:hypothetical protein
MFPLCILNRWKNYFCLLLNVHSVNDVRQTEIDTAESVPCMADTATKLLKRYISTGNVKLSEELIQAGGNTLRSGIYRLSYLEYGRIATVMNGISSCAYLRRR